MILTFGSFVLRGDVAELSDAKVSKTFKCNLVCVRFPPSPPESVVSVQWSVVSRRLFLIPDHWSLITDYEETRNHFRFNPSLRNLEHDSEDLPQVRLRPVHKAAQAHAAHCVLRTQKAHPRRSRYHQRCNIAPPLLRRARCRSLPLL